MNHGMSSTRGSIGGSAQDTTRGSIREGIGGVSRRAIVCGATGITLAGGAWLLAACGSQPEAQSGAGAAGQAAGSLEYWFSVGQQREAMMLQMIRSFEAAKPQIKINYTHVPGDRQLLEKLIVSSASGTPPDTAFLNAPFVPALATAGLLELTPLASKDKSFVPSQVFEPSGLEMAKYWSLGAGKLYALPIGNGLIHMYYSRDAFQEAGLTDPNELYDKGRWTWADAVTAATKLTKRVGGTVEHYGYAADFDILRAIGFVHANGGRIFDVNQKRFVFGNEAAAIEAVQWVLDLKDRYAVTQPTPAPAGEPTNRQQLFQTGKAAMFHGFATYLASMVSAIGSHFRYGAAPMPVGKQEATYGNANFFGILRDSKQHELAWAFVKHAVGPEAYAIYMQNGFVYVPVLKDKRAKDAFTQYGAYGSDRLLKHSLKTVTDQFVTPKVQEMRQTFNTHAGAIWQSEVAVRTGLQAAQTEMQVIYDAG